MTKPAASQFDARQRRPDFVVHIEINENTSARLFAYRDVGSAVSDAGLMAAGGEGRRAPVRNAGVGLGLMLNASIRNAGFNPVPVPSTIQEDDATGFQKSLLTYV